MGSQGGEDSWQGGSWRTREEADCGMGQARLQLADLAAPHSLIDKPGAMSGEQSRPGNPGLQLGEIKPQTSE